MNRARAIQTSMSRTGCLNARLGFAGQRPSGGSGGGVVLHGVEISGTPLDFISGKFQSRRQSVKYPFASDTFYNAWTPRKPPARLSRRRRLYNRLPEVSTRALYELDEIFSILSGRPLNEQDVWFSRAAPSIITRGEAEMLGLSDPRFSRRVLMYSNKECLGLVNVRRMRRLGDQLKNYSLLKALHKSSSIGDSILRIPEKFNEDEWHVLTLPPEITTYYGDEFLARNSVLGDRTVPFLRHVDIAGGGLCAQACCFMATLLTHRWAKQIVSIPEISYLGVEPTGDQLRLSGLNEIEAQQYFLDETTGLGATIQTGPKLREEATFPTNADWSRVLHALKAYLSCGCPVICTVDDGRMKGKDSPNCRIPASKVITHPEEWPNRKSKRKFENCRHMVLAIGFKRTDAKLLVNDPGNGPFVELHVSDLFQNACYVKGTSGKTRGKYLGRPHFIPVCPKNVRLPLLDFLYARAGQHSFDEGKGLFSYLVYFDEGRHFKKGIRGCIPKLLESEFTLIQLSELHAKLLSRFGESRLKGFQSWIDSLFRIGWPKDHWTWLQINDHFIFIWDAQADPLQGQRNYENFLIGVGRNLDGQYEWCQSRAKSPEVSVRAVSTSDLILKHSTSIKPGVITSVSADGIPGIASCLNGAKLPLDVYCFLTQDMPHVLGRAHVFGERPVSGLTRSVRNGWCFWASLVRAFPLKINWNKRHFFRLKGDPLEPLVIPGPSVCEWLAANYGQEHFVTRTAERLNNYLNVDSGCFAASTFFPGITSDDKNERHRCARALKCLIRILKKYNKNFGGTIRTLEIVCGSLIGTRRIPRAPLDGEQSPGFLVNMVPKKQAHDYLFEILEDIAIELNDELSVVLELEPGPLFAVSTWDDLVNIVNRIDNCEALQKNFGVNCDIGHWCLAGINPSDLLGDMQSGRSQVCHRILHAHISDFWKGHLADLRPCVVNNHQLFTEWIFAVTAAFDLARTNNLRPTGYLSLELELPESRSALSTGIQTTFDLCRKTRR